MWEDRNDRPGKRPNKKVYAMRLAHHSLQPSGPRRVALSVSPNETYSSVMVSRGSGGLGVGGD